MSNYTKKQVLSCENQTLTQPTMIRQMYSNNRTLLPNTLVRVVNNTVTARVLPATANLARLP
jgi:hypothetical protein